MSSTAYYNFTTSNKHHNSARIHPLTGAGSTNNNTSNNEPLENAGRAGNASVAARHNGAISPSSLATSSSSPSESNSSLNQFNSLTQGSSAAMACSSSSSTTSSSSSSSANNWPTSTANYLPQFSPNLHLHHLQQQHQQQHHQVQHNSHQHFPLHRTTSRDLFRRSSVTPTQATSIGSSSPSSSSRDHSSSFHHHQGSQQLMHSYTLHSLDHKPLKPYKTKSEYLEAMKEDLSEWLNRLYPDLDLTADNFFTQLETGSIICRHANNVTQMGRNFLSQEQRRREEEEEEEEAGDSHDDNDYNSGSFIEQNNNHHCRPASKLETKLARQTSPAVGNGFSLRDQSFRMSRSLSMQPIRDNSDIMKQHQFNQQRIHDTSRHDCNTNWFAIKTVPYKLNAEPGTFFARDNICQFILWCRSLNVRECLLFETDDLVARKNEKSFVLCLLEVARIGFKVGMPTPLIIQFEQEIDREIENDARLEQAEKQIQDIHDTNSDEHILNCSVNSSDSGNVCGKDCDNDLDSLEIVKDDNGSRDKIDESGFGDELIASEEKEAQKEQDKQEEEEEEEEEDFGPKPQVITNDLLTLHERVVQLLCQCQCPTQFPMVRIGDGKYKVGDKLIIFVRILRRHIMVRVGGGWQELSEFLRLKDPCRSKLCANNPIQQQYHQNKLIQNTTNALRSRLMSVTSNQTLNQFNQPPPRNPSGQRLISSSVSMSWLSHN